MAAEFLRVLCAQFSSSPSSAPALSVFQEIIASSSAANESISDSPKPLDQTSMNLRLLACLRESTIPSDQIPEISSTLLNLLYSICQPVLESVVSSSRSSSDFHQLVIFAGIVVECLRQLATKEVPNAQLIWNHQPFQGCLRQLIAYDPKSIQIDRVLFQVGSLFSSIFVNCTSLVLFSIILAYIFRRSIYFD
jgi:hypothetical protein